MRARPGKLDDNLATKSLQGRRCFEEEKRKSIASYELNNSVFVLNETN